MMKRRTTTLLVIAATLATGAAYIANTWAINRSSGGGTMAVNETSVVVATLDIPYGQKVEDQHVKMIKVPKHIVPDGAFNTTEEIIGQVANNDALRGDILRSMRFSTHLQGSTLASLINKNKRAITVRVDDVVGVGGFLLPGNRVDVLATKRVNKKYTTKTVLKDLKVLAVDQTASTNENSPVIVRAVTLEVEPKQAETIVKARNEGTIQLSLRNPNEQVLVKAPKPKKIYRGYIAKKITVIRGTNISTVTR